MNAPVDVGRFGSGHAVRRIEDPALIAGLGRFTDDVVPAGQTHLVFLRSPHAHARIVSIDTSAARAIPGVLAVWTGADLVAAGLKPPTRSSARTARPARRRRATCSRTNACATSARPSWRSSPRHAMPRSTAPMR
jgi:CO/xanthine dehydrogenase Mo-binding subunit